MIGDGGGQHGGEHQWRDGGPRSGADRPIHQVRSDGQIVGEIRSDTPIFLISVAAELAGMHAQTLRSYDREGLVRPRRTSGGGRRYSQRDIELLQQVQQLSQDAGVNRAGIRRIIELEGTVDALRDRLEELHAEIAELRAVLDTTGAPAPGSEPDASRDAPDASRDVSHSGGAASDSSGAAPEPAPGDRREARHAVVAVRREVVPWRSRTTAIVTWSSTGR